MLIIYYKNEMFSRKLRLSINMVNFKVNNIMLSEFLFMESYTHRKNC